MATNREAYKSMIEEIIGVSIGILENGKPCPCGVSGCMDAECIFCNEHTGCNESKQKAYISSWLDAEYIPPTLENGDGLRQGDKIEVYSEAAEVWREAEYIAMHGGKFVVRTAARYDAYSKARLCTT